MNNKNATLELIRGLSAVYVVLYHLFSFHYREEFISIFGINVLLQFAFGREAVLAFFLLSGVVNRLSLEHRSKTTFEFTRSRFRRLYPAYFVIVLVTAIGERLKYGEFDPIQLIGHLVLLQSHFDDGIHVYRVNEPLWTMAAEAFFYGLAALFLCNAQFLGRIIAWLLVLTAFAVDTLFNCDGFLAHFVDCTAWFSIWLVGYYAKELSQFMSFSKPMVGFSLGFIPVINSLGFTGHSPTMTFYASTLIAPMFLYSIDPPKQKRATGVIMAWLFIFCVSSIAVHQMHIQSIGSKDVVKLLARPVVLAILAPFIVSACTWLITNFGSIVLTLGRGSYVLYLIHQLLIVFAASHSFPLSWAILFVLIGSVAGVWLVEWKINGWVQSVINAWPQKRGGTSSSIVS